MDHTNLAEYKIYPIYPKLFSLSKQLIKRKARDNNRYPELSILEYTYYN